MILKKLLSKPYYKYVHPSALGYRLRHMMGGEPFIELKPFKRKASVTDLFVWRCDDTWDTEFEVFNITSFLLPHEQAKEDVEIMIFDLDGKKIGTKEMTLEPFERITLSMRSFVGEIDGAGTFAVFHYSDHTDKFSEHDSHLTERGYIGYRRKGDSLKSFCHGNLQALAKTKSQNSYAYVTAFGSEQQSYKPQLILSDCKRVELVYTNPTAKSHALSVNFYDREHQKIRDVSVIVPARGVRILDVENTDGIIHTFDNSGKILLWRPVLFKYSDTHFDVMHG